MNKQIKPNYFNEEMEATANAMLIDLSVTGQCSDELVRIAYNLYFRLLNKTSYSQYDPELKEDMVSLAIEWLLRYGRNYNPAKSTSKHPAFSFLTVGAENAFKRVLVTHYKNVNIQKLLNTAIDMIINEEVIITEEEENV